MEKNCIFQIARGETSRFVYVFNYQGSYYNVTKKVLYGNLPYKIISTIKVPTSQIRTFINTVVALTY